LPASLSLRRIGFQKACLPNGIYHIDYGSHRFHIVNSDDLRPVQNAGGNGPGRRELGIRLLFFL
jgi:hypothetical protein